MYLQHAIAKAIVAGEFEVVASLHSGEQRKALTEHDGDHRDDHLVDEVGVERLSDEVAPVEVDVAPARLFECRVDQFVDVAGRWGCASH